MKKQIIALLTMFFSVIMMLTQNTVAHDPLAQAENMSDEDPIAYFYKSLTFTPAGTRCFLKHIYNRREYTNDFLPHNFSHFMQFLLHGKNTKQSPVYSRSVIKLFAQKIKAVPYINHAAFTEFLEKLPELVAHNFTDQDTTVALSTLSRKLHQLLYDNFLHKFEQFRTNPDDFFAALAQEITTLTHEQTLQSVEQEYLRQSLIRCLEASINKLIWSPDDQELIWESFKTIAYQLQQLTNKGIITDIDNLDDLAWSLVHRFCFFLENLGGYISPALYNRMKEDIASQAISLLNLEEQEELIMSKNEHLMQTIYEGEAKARAQLEGIY